MSIRAIRSDTEHLPCVIEVKANAAFPCGGFGSYEESCTCGSLRVKEPYGGGEALIVEPLTFAIDHVVCGGGNCTAQGPCYYEEISPTLKAGGVHGVVYTVDMGGGKSSVCTYEDQSPTLTCTHYGEPAVAYTLKIRGGCETYQTWSGKTAKAGKGPLIQIEKSATIAVSQDQILFQPINNPG